MSSKINKIKEDFQKHRLNQELRLKRLESVLDDLISSSRENKKISKELISTLRDLKKKEKNE